MITKLYHGTNEHAWRAMQAAGAINPRRLCKASNWDHTIKSHPNCVYLTDTYAPYFGVVSVTDKIIQTDDNARIAIIELDVAAIIGNLVPDEDALEQSSRAGAKIGTRKMYERTRKFIASLHNYRGTDAWQASLNYMGTCAHFGPIPLAAITRVALVPMRASVETRQWSLDALQPSITRANYVYCGERYRDHLAQAFTMVEATIEEPNHDRSH